MSLMERFAAVFRSHAPETETAQPAREALFDLLVWTMFVDRHLSLAEHDKLDELTSDRQWSATRSPADYFSESVARAREVVENGGAEPYLQSIVDRLGEGEPRRRAAIACEQMMGADGKLTPEEVDHLLMVSRALGLRD